MGTRSGPKSFYKPDEEAWLQSAFDEYLALIKDNPTDLAVQRVFKNKKTEEFLAQFETQLVDTNREVEPNPVTDIDKWRKRVKELFKNVKHRRLSKSVTPDETLENFNPLNALRDANVLTGRDLYREANRVSITDQATKDREACGDPPSKQIGYFQSAEKRAWESLTVNEKERWDSDAAPQQTLTGKSYTSPQIVINQKAFVRAMTKVLRSMVGFDKDQIGLVSFNLMYGIRGEGGIIESGCISVNAARDEKAFHESFDNYKEQFMAPFTTFCEHTIPRLESAQDKQITAPLVIRFDCENYPILPSWDDDDAKPLSDVKALLRSYLDELWKRIWPCDDDMPTTPWDMIEKEPDTYFDTATLPAGIPLLQPESLTRAQVYMLVEHIHSCQTVTHGNETTVTQRFVFRSKAEIQEVLSHMASPTHDSENNNPSQRNHGSGLENETPASDGHGANTLNPQNAANMSLGDVEPEGNTVDAEAQETDDAANEVIAAGPTTNSRKNGKKRKAPGDVDENSPPENVEPKRRQQKIILKISRPTGTIIRPALRPRKPVTYK